MKSKWTLVIMVLAIIALHTHKALETSDIDSRNSLPKVGGAILATQRGDSIIIEPGKNVFLRDNWLKPLKMSSVKPGM